MFNIAKPCIKKCCLNEKEVCLGCFRTLSDMKVWHKASMEEKTKMLEEAQRRKEAHRLSSLT